MKLLTMQNAKTIKGQKYGYLTGILYLAPANQSGIANTCPFATEECKAACLYTAGRAGIFRHINEARVAKTQWLYRDRESFLAQLRKDIHALVRKAKRMGLRPCVRLNGTSDLAWLPDLIASEFPRVMFYDYTKIPKPWLRVAKHPNYRITFSYSGHNMPEALEALDYGINVAVVFHTKRTEALPKVWNGIPVIDGDKSDLRFKDPHGIEREGLIVGLRAKGRARKLASPFVVLN